MRTVSIAEVSAAPRRSFASASSIAQDFRAWYGSADNTSAILFRLGGKEDTERDGNDAQLRDALCKLAAIPRQVKIGPDGNPVVSEKRGKVQYLPYSTADRISAHTSLGTEERDMGKVGDSRMVAIVRVSEESATLADFDDDDDDNDDDN